MSVFMAKLKLDDRGLLFPEGWEKKIDHDMKIKEITKTPTKNGEGGRTPKHERFNGAERRRGRGRTQEGRRDGRRLRIKSVKDHFRTQSE
ncbi:hypothetical protein TNCV_2034191 [Trichonephila clavipes]|nr:hypothetical protein TNCV_2034191 [Trichonephila clavipes]